MEPLEDRSLLSVCIWTGGGTSPNWNNADNWVNDQQPPAHVTPQAGNQLQFTGTPPSGGTVNDFPDGTSFESIDFASDDFALAGNAITLTGGIAIASGVTGSTISLNVALAGPLTVDVADTTLAISGSLSGSNYLTKSGAGTLSLAGANTYSGGTVIGDGTLKVENDAALVECGNGLLVNGENAVLDLNGHNVTVGAVGLINGSIQSTTAASITATSYVVMNGSIDVGLHGTNAPLIKGAASTVTLSGTNDYTGPTTVYAGQLTLVGSDAWNPVLTGGGDIQDGKLVLDYSTSPSSDQASDVSGDLTAGYGATSKFSTGPIHSSTAAFTSTALGWADNATSQQVTIARARYGDANLDGSVNALDFNLLLANWGGTGKTWSQGDFNYDGTVNGLDFSIMLGNWVPSPTPLPPQVAEIARLGAAETTSNSAQFVVVFSKGVSGVNANDFAPQCSDTTATVADVNDCSPSHAVYLVTVTDVYGNGTLGLSFADTDGSVEDYTTGVPLPESNRNFSESDQSYTVSSPFIWVGGGSDNNWYTAGNWQEGIRPIVGGSLLFEGAPPDNVANNNFTSGASFKSIEFASSGFDLTGIAITLTGGIIVDAGVSNVTISADIVLSGPVTIDVGNEASLTISGGISGSGSLTKTGSGTPVLTGANTYTGPTTVDDGALQLGLNAQAVVLTGGGADIQGVDGRLILDYTGGDDPDDAVEALLTASYDAAGGHFASGRIFCSTASGNAGLGWSDDKALSRLTIARTLYGDANLDGTVNGLDFNVLLGHWNQNGMSWAQGDFNYDRQVSGIDFTIWAGNWARSIGTGELLLNDKSVFSVEVTDDAPETLDVTGAVSLGNATLNVTSSRTNTDYGILRVLIQNDGTDPVVGTFKDLPEGSPVVVDGVNGEEEYFITYHYNAETGQFGTGNDVALCSSSYAMYAQLLADQATTDYEDTATPVEDATELLRASCSKYQLSPNLWAAHDPTWAAGSPTYAYQSKDTSKATVDANGLVTFLPPAGKKVGGSEIDCTILITATEAGMLPRTFEVPIAGFYMKEPAYIPDTITAENVGNYVLVLYNADSTDSTDLAAYYKNNRPGMENASYLGITGVPETGNGTSVASDSACQSLISQVMAWLNDHNWLGANQSEPATPIRYVVGLGGLPSRDSDGDSVSYMIYQNALNITGGTGYQGGTDRFSLAEYGAPLVAWLDCGSYAATEAYINKEAAAANANGLEADGVTISGSAAGVGGNTWVLDDTCHGSDSEGSTYAADGDAFDLLRQLCPDDRARSAGEQCGRPQHGRNRHRRKRIRPGSSHGD